MQSNEIEESSYNLFKYAYLFVTDLCRSKYHNYRFYADTEPNYAQSWLEGYIEAFSRESDGILTHELIQSIHQKAMGFQEDSIPGEYRSLEGYYDIAPKCYIDPQGEKNFCPVYNASEEGLKEFLNYWMIDSNTREDTHALTIGQEQKRMGISFGVSNEDEKLTVYLIDSGDIKSRNFSLKEAIGLTDSYFDRWGTNSLITVMSTDLPSAVIYQDIQKKVTQVMGKIIAAYHEKMSDAVSDDKKLHVIVETIQRIDQCHPFKDGNVRTCYILLNKLLRDHGLPLTLLINPNRFDCCSISELVDMVKQGQVHFNKLKNLSGIDRDGLIFEYPKEELELLQSIKISPQALFDVEESVIKKFLELLLAYEPSYSQEDSMTMGM